MKEAKIAFIAVKTNYGQISLMGIRDLICAFNKKYLGYINYSRNLSINKITDNIKLLQKYFYNT